MNRVILMGRLGNDPELKTTGSGKSVCKMRIATTEQVKKGNDWVEETEWHSVTLWGKRGETAAKHLRKGDRVLIEGRNRTSSYEDREGVKRYSTEVVAATMEFASDKKSSNGGNSSAQSNRDEEEPSYGYEDEGDRPSSSSSRRGRG